MVDEPKEGDLRVWWIPQVPGKSFKVPVKNIEQAVLIYKTLADYDLFQYTHNIKPDYCNVGGLEVYTEEEPGVFEWCDWSDDEGNDIREYL